MYVCEAARESAYHGSCGAPDSVFCHFCWPAPWSSPPLEVSRREHRRPPQRARITRKPRPPRDHPRVLSPHQSPLQPPLHPRRPLRQQWRTTQMATRQLSLPPFPPPLSRLRQRRPRLIRRPRPATSACPVAISSSTGQPYTFLGVNAYEIGTEFGINPGCGAKCPTLS